MGRAPHLARLCLKTDESTNRKIYNEPLDVTYSSLETLKICVCLKISEKPEPARLSPAPPFKIEQNRSEQGKKHCPFITLKLAHPGLVVTISSTLARKG